MEFVSFLVLFLLPIIHYSFVSSFKCWIELTNPLQCVNMYSMLKIQCKSICMYLRCFCFRFHFHSIFWANRVWREWEMWESKCKIDLEWGTILFVCLKAFRFVEYELSKRKTGREGERERIWHRLNFWIGLKHENIFPSENTHTASKCFVNV